MGGILLPPASLCLPTNRGGPGADLANDTRPTWVLLDPLAFVLDRRNSTTATCKFMCGKYEREKELQVTFVVAHPPNVSYFCVYCRGLKPSRYPMEPRIMATEADLVLFRIILGGGGAYGLGLLSDSKYFIYRAGEGVPPSLEQLPRPSRHLLRGDPFGLLKYDTGYIVLTLGDDTSATHRGPSPDKFQLCLLDSKDKVWTAKPVDLPRIDQFYHETSKVITIGGERGTVAFVDLWRGILLYDVLANDPLLRYTPLPETICEKAYSVDPVLMRDIAVVKGNIKFVEMDFEVMTDTGLKGPNVATYSMPVTCCQEDAWHHDGIIDAQKIRDDKNILSPEVLRMLKDEEGMKLEPTMEILDIGQPTLCLHDEDIVYFLTKVRPRSKKACVIAVSMTEGSTKAVARFGAERTYGVNFAFIKSRISGYLDMASGTEGPGLKKKKKGKKGAGFKAA